LQQYRHKAAMSGGTDNVRSWGAVSTDRRNTLS
jgi:hypothetical protein